MKKKILSFVVVLMTVFSFTPVFAAGFSFSASTSSTTPGKSFSATVRLNGEGRFDLRAEGGTISGSSSVWIDKSYTFTVTPSAGASSVRVFAVATDAVDVNAEDVVGTQTVVVSVKENTNTGGNNNSGNNSGNNNGGSRPPSSGKTPEQIAKEREEAQKAAQEAAQKTSLVNGIKITSNSLKMYGEVLNTLTPEVDKWDYAYTLPKRVDKVFLDVSASDPSTTLTFDKELDFKELGANEHVFEIRASLGDVQQTIKYTIRKDVSEPATLSFKEANVSLFEDEVLDKFMTESAGFTRMVYQDATGREVSYFARGSLKLQAIVNESKKASWVMLDENNMPMREVVVLFDGASRPFVIYNAPEAIANRTVQGESYRDDVFVVQDVLNKIDDSLTWTNTYKSWKLENGSVIYGVDDTGKEGNFFFDKDGNIGFAIVSYDEAQPVNYKVWSYVATATSVVLAASFGSYIFINSRIRRKG